MINIFNLDIFTYLNYFYTNFPILSYLLITFFSLVIGSFLNVIIYRLPVSIFNEWRTECYEYLDISDRKDCKQQITKNITIFRPYRSICPHCNTQVKSYDNIPLFSFIILKGKCRTCQNQISWQYPLIELLSVLTTMLILFQYGFTSLSLLILLLNYLLIVIAAIDYEHLIIPDNLTYVGLWLGLLVSIQFFNNESLTDINQAILGCVFGYLALWSLYWVFKIFTGKEGFGHGDFKLTALFGAWLGLSNLLPLLIIASVTGIIGSLIAKILNTRELDQPFPFGPYLALAGWIMLLYKDYWPLTNLGVIY